MAVLHSASPMFVSYSQVRIVHVLPGLDQVLRNRAQSSIGPQWMVLVSHGLLNALDGIVIRNLTTSCRSNLTLTQEYT